MRQLKHLCQDDPGALDAIDRATVGGRGRPHKTEENRNNVTNKEPERGNANTYALRKLRKDRPDLHERVLSEEISPHAAMVEMRCVRTSRNVPGSLELATRLIRPVSETHVSRKPASATPDRPIPPKMYTRRRVLCGG